MRDYALLLSAVSQALLLVGTSSSVVSSWVLYVLRLRTRPSKAPFSPSCTALAQLLPMCERTPAPKHVWPHETQDLRARADIAWAYKGSFGESLSHNYSRQISIVSINAKQIRKNKGPMILQLLKLI